MVVDIDYFDWFVAMDIFNCNGIWYLDHDDIKVDCIVFLLDYVEGDVFWDVFDFYY